MNGYMTKLQGYVYEGTLANGTGAGVPNGMILVQGTGTDADKLVMPSADSTKMFVCMEVTDMFGGVPAYRFQVEKMPQRYFFVENSFQFNVEAYQEYDKRDYEQPDGELMRAHALLLGDEFVTNCVTGTPVVGTVYGVKADGTIG